MVGGSKLSKKLLEMAERLGPGAEVQVGFFPGQRYPTDAGGNYVAQIAFWNEYGTPAAKHPIPPRPFFRNMVAKESPDWARKLGLAAKYTGYRAKPTLEIMGAEMAGQLRKSINDLVDPPNAPYTIAKKGASKPLVGLTKTLQSAPSWVYVGGRPTK